jgi:hypothetical protein
VSVLAKLQNMLRGMLRLIEPDSAGFQRERRAGAEREEPRVLDALPIRDHASFARGLVDKQKLLRSAIVWTERSA